MKKFIKFYSVKRVQEKYIHVK